MSRFCILGLFGLMGVAMCAEGPKQPPLHRQTEFSFVIGAPLKTAFPLFGAYKEREWADGWDPDYIHPVPAGDETGAVFIVKGGHSSVWINTVYDLSRGHIQYACFAKERMATLINIHLYEDSAASTKASCVTSEQLCIPNQTNM